MARFGTIEIPDAIAPAWIVLTNANEGGEELLSVVEGDFRAVFHEESPSARRSKIASAAASLVGSGLCVVYRQSSLHDKTNLPLSDQRIAPGLIAGLATDLAAWGTATIATTPEGHAVWLSGPEALAERLE